MTSQKASGERFLPVFFVDEVKIGESFDTQDWPLHMTLFPPLDTPYTVPLGESIRQCVNGADSFTATIIGEDVYGLTDEIAAGRGVLVHTIEKTPQLDRVHSGLVRALAHIHHDPTFRLPYNPHITKHSAGRILSLGESVLVEGMSIATRQPDSATWTVVDKMRFKGEQSA